MHDGMIDLAAPSGLETLAGLGPVWVYRCPKCGTEKRIVCRSFVGGHPRTDVGAVSCNVCLPPERGAEVRT